MFLVKRNNTPNTLRLLDTFRKDMTLMDRLFDEFSHFHGFPTVGGLETPDFSPSLEIVEKDKSFEGKLELPGMTEKDVEISIDDNILTIKGEKKREMKEEGEDYVVEEISYGSFRRELPVPTNVDPEGIKAAFKDGILTLSLPKIEEKKKETKKIAINKS